MAPARPPIAAVLGAGYVGRALVPHLRAAGYHPRLIRRSPGPGEHFGDLDDPDTLAVALSDATIVLHLAPPPASLDEAKRQWAALRAVDPDWSRYIYGSSTAACGAQGESWVDEDTPDGPRCARGQRRADYEAGLQDAGLPLRVVRIAGIYGPGRGVLSRVAAQTIRPDPAGGITSRIHVSDLARLLVALAGPDAPRRTLATDEAPAPTAEVIAYAAQLLGQPCPAPEPATARSERWQPGPGRRCRSLHRAKLIGALRFPTYREGLLEEAARLGLGRPRPPSEGDRKRLP